MARGPKKHQKRINAPKSWMMDKLQGIYATRPSQGPHKLRECIPLYVILKNRLKFATTGREVTQILQDKEVNVRVDGRIRRDRGFPAGIMDVVTIEKTGQSYRVLYDTKGRFVLKSLKEDEAKIKLLKVIHKGIGPNQIPYIVTHDARTIRFPHPDIEVGSSVKYDISNNTIVDWVKCDLGNSVYITQGNNIGRVGVITHIEKHMGTFDIVHIRDSLGKTFSTRLGNIFVIGKNKKCWITLPKDQGLYMNALEQHEKSQKKPEKKEATKPAADSKKK